uniref:Uncharacterized protein n=1 Tax=Steinernema glaseri TaxID=37863 RepID=A0A1I7Y8U7_9BILA
MGDYKEQKRALAEAGPPARIDLGVFNNEQSTSLVTNQTLDDDDRPPPYPGVAPREFLALVILTIKCTNYSINFIGGLPRTDLGFWIPF